MPTSVVLEVTAFEPLDIPYYFFFYHLCTVQSPYFIACSNTLTILLVFARSSVLKLAGKTHYSNVSFRVGSIGSVLVYRHWFLPVVRYWLLPVNSPTAGHIWKHVFPKGSNDRYTFGEFFSVPVFTNIIQDTMRKLKKHSKRKLQILNADFSPQF